MARELLLHQPAEGRIHHRHERRRHLDDRRPKTAGCKGLRHLNADETSAHNHRCLRPSRLQRSLQPVHVGHGPEPEDLLPFRARNDRHDRQATLRENQLVVAQPDRSARALETHTVACPVDLDHLRVHPHIDAILVTEPFRRLEQEARALLDVAAQEVGQPAVGVGDVGAALDEHDLTIGVDAAGTRGCSGACGNAAHDDDALLRFHDCLR